MLKRWENENDKMRIIKIVSSLSVRLYGWINRVLVSAVQLLDAERVVFSNSPTATFPYVYVH